MDTNINTPALGKCDSYFNICSQLFNNQYLKKQGYLRSLIEGKVEDADGNPVPWYTYPAIDLCRERVRDNLSVFEFGCGYGTFWWATHTRKVTVIEHNREWFSSITPKFPPNVRHIYRDLEKNGAYSHILLELLPLTYDVIIIDGRDRVNCSYNCIQSLTERGIIIWDNTDRERYLQGREFIRKAGFKELRLYGLTPMVATELNATSFFYRVGNCFGL